MSGEIPDESGARRSISTSTTISIALVIAIGGGIAGNLTMMFGIRERVSVFEAHMTNVLTGLNEIRRSVDAISVSVRSDVNALQNQINEMRERLIKVEAASLPK